MAAARKIAWSSLMWLMCHADEDGEPVTARHVHEFRSEELRRLVEEAKPALDALASESWTGNGPTDQQLIPHTIQHYIDMCTNKRETRWHQVEFMSAAS